MLLRKAFLLSLPLLLLSFTVAHASETAKIKVSQPDDSALTCKQIRTEISSLGGIIDDAQQTQKDSKMAGTGVGVAKTVGAYLIGSLGGALGIMAAGAIVSEAADDSAEEAAKLQDNATQRRSLLAGMYKGKKCEGDLDFIQDALNATEPAAGTQKAVIARHKPMFNE